ncbi:uncharacterized protein LOC126552899 [Aphis gossypii]|uniref:uncharacterized protein LOC126552899 n=1 Tax=Aphis gossypii TaxID=80765 RepID=UPI0021598A6C|nr:uncharacterized protein LOC126552899 [Aphis gossypii]
MVPLHDLLTNWGLGFLFQTLLDELICMKGIIIMEADQAYELLKHFPLGIRLLFVYNLKKWQKTQENDMKSTNTPQLNLKASTNQPIQYHHQNNINNISINLGEVLNSSNTGLMILQYYKSNQKLNDGIRSMLVDTVINWVITKKINMSVNLAEQLANQLVSIFPTEVKDLYFMKHDSNKNPKGKLYAKYYNSIRLLKTTGLVATKLTSRNQEKHSGRKHCTEFEPEQSVQYAVDEIKNNNNFSNFNDLEKLWKETVNYRLNSIQNTNSTKEIMGMWKPYTLPYGFRLVDIDFKKLYPECPDFINSYEQKHIKVKELFEIKIKDSSSRKLFEEYKNSSCITESGKNTVFFYLLHSIFVPTSKKVTRDGNGKKNQIKYSIRDSQDTFFVFKNTIGEIEEYILHLGNENMPIQPFILLVGTPLNHKEIIVYFDSIKYRMFNILSAIDICFKIFHLFNLEYPPASSIVWTFIQNIFTVLIQNMTNLTIL